MHIPAPEYLPMIDHISRNYFYQGPKPAEPVQLPQQSGRYAKGWYHWVGRCRMIPVDHNNNIQYRPVGRKNQNFRGIHGLLPDLHGG